MPDLFSATVTVLQAMLCAFYIGSMRSFRREANKELICILIGAAMATAVTAADQIFNGKGVFTLAYPAVMLVFSAMIKGGVLIKLLAGAAPLLIGTVINYLFIEYAHFSKGIYFRRKLEYYPELFYYSTSLYMLLFVSFMILAGVIEKRKLIARYDRRMLLTFILFSASADCLIYYYSVCEIQRIDLGPIHNIVVLLVSALCLHLYSMSEQQARQSALENDLRIARLSEHYSRQYIDSLKQQYFSVRKIKHDMHNSFLTLAGLIRDGDYEAAARFAGENCQALEAMQTFVDTGSSVADAVINSKLSYAAELGISTRCLSVSRISGISDSDLCSLLGNALDNALAACAALPADMDREIWLEISCENERFYTFTVRNTVAAPVLKDNPGLATTKEDKSSHGLGTRIIRETAARCGGRADFYEEDGMFCCRIAAAAPCDK